eukprot:12671182-Alexandrium_andersonii.AAC.1
MSASLVGSEMCIRDRRSHDRAGCGSGVCQPAITTCRGAEHPQGHRTLQSCLLYTSDAADDM